MSNNNKSVAHQHAATVTLTTTDILASLDLTVDPTVQFDLVVAHKLLTLQQRTAAKKQEFNLTFKRLKQLMKQETCYYSGVKFVEKDWFLARTLDRVDNDKGYTDDNIVACTAQFNKAKANMSLKQLQTLIKGIIRFDKKVKAKEKAKLKVLTPSKSRAKKGAAIV